MNHYAGLDVSLEETAICAVDETGRIVKEARAASESQALIDALTTIGLPLERIGLEACSLTAWLHDALRSAGLPAICIAVARIRIMCGPERGICRPEVANDRGARVASASGHYVLG